MARTSGGAIVTALRDTSRPPTLPTPVPTGDTPPALVLPGVREPTPVCSPTLSPPASRDAEPLGESSTSRSRLPASTRPAVPENASRTPLRGADPLRVVTRREIGRASCRERV